jgi:hypothetical protein
MIEAELLPTDGQLPGIDARVLAPGHRSVLTRVTNVASAGKPGQTGPC